MRSRTDTVTAGVRSAIAVVAIGISTWGAKALGATVGFALGGPAGAATLGAGLSAMAARATAIFLTEYYIGEVRKALKRLNEQKSEFVKKKAQDSAQTIKRVSTALDSVEARRVNIWRAVLARFNLEFDALTKAHVSNERRVFAFVRDELRYARQDIVDSTARRRLGSKLTCAQRVLWWLSPAIRHQIKDHFQRRLKGRRPCTFAI